MTNAIYSRQTSEARLWEDPINSKGNWKHGATQLLASLSAETVKVADLNELFTRTRLNLPVNSPDDLKWDIDSRQELAELATKFMTQWGKIVIDKVQVTNVDYLPTQPFLLGSLVWSLIFTCATGDVVEVWNIREVSFTPTAETAIQAEVSAEDAEEVTAELLMAEWISIQGKIKSPYFTQTYLDENDIFITQFNKDIAKFVSRVEEFLEKWGKIFATAKWSEEKIPVTGAADAVGGIVFYSGTTVIGTSTGQDLTTSKTVPTQVPHWSYIIFEDPEVE